MTVFTDPACYPAASLHQPYAGAIRLSGLGYPAKRIETRTTRIHYRGPLVICATAKDPSDAWRTQRELYDYLKGEQAKVAPTWTAPLLKQDGLPCDDVDEGFDHALMAMTKAFNLRACAVAIVKVVGCRRLVEEDFPRSLWWDAAEVTKKPRWAWILEDITPLRPFPVKGAQTFFRLPRQQVDYAAMHGIGDLFQQGGATRTEAGLLGAFSWPLLDELDGSR